MTTARGLWSMLLAIGLAAAGVACGDDDESVSENASGNVLKVIESDYAFAVTGAPRGGALTIDVENTGTEDHDLGMAKLLPGKTVDDVRKALASAQDEDNPLAGVVEEGSAIDDIGAGLFPGTELSLTGTGIEPGDYSLVCFVSNAEGKPHWSLGMIAGFTIAEGSSEETPKPDVTFTVDDKGVDGPESLDRGPTTIKVANDSSVSREIQLVHVKQGKTIKSVYSFFAGAGEGGPPSDRSAWPVDFLTFVHDAKQDRFITVDLVPGHWAIGVLDPNNEEQKAPELDPFLHQFEVA